MAPKSILKKTTDLTKVPSGDAGTTKADRARETALYHANLIQAQKDVESEILEALEALIEFPTDPNASTVHPSPSDVTAFTQYVLPFQPSDYDSLLEERRIAGKCGYVFCSKPPKKTSGGGKFKIVGKKKGQEFKVVEREKMDCWCSVDCARRALYVKVQLDEEPAWQRRSGASPQIEVLVGDQGDYEEGRIAKVEEAKLKAQMESLALERGDAEKPGRAERMIKEVVEKDDIAAPPSPSNDEPHDTIEGYGPKGINLVMRPKIKEHGSEVGDREWDI
jgi:hypothetical protein